MSYFNRINYRTWLDKYFDYFEKNNRSYFLASLFTALFIFLLGLLFSIFGNFTKLYLITPQIYFALLGIIWVMCWFRWGYINFFKIIKDFIPLLELNKRNIVYKKLDSYMKLATSYKIIIPTCIFLILLFFLTVISFYIKINIFTYFHLYHSFLPKEWFYGNNINIFFKSFILTIYASYIGLLVGTVGSEIIVFEVKIVKTLSSYIDNNKYLLLPFKLKKITSFCLNITKAWSVGIAICGMALISKFTSFILIFIFFFILVGIVSFVFPQYMFHKSLKKMKSKLLLDINYQIYHLINISKNRSLFQKYNFYDNFTFLFQKYELIKKSSSWLINFNVLPKLLLYSSLPPLVFPLIPQLVLLIIKFL